jgi:hypothetical protein
MTALSIRSLPVRVLLLTLAAAVAAWLIQHVGAAGVSIGAVTLAEAAKLSETRLQRGVIETFLLESKILDRIPLLEIEGNAYGYNEEATLPGVEFRAVNAGYAESTGTVNQRTESLVILGGDADVDRFIQQTRSNLQDQRATQTRLKVKAAVYKYQDTFINGDTAVDANSFDGLKKRLTGNQVVDAATNGLPILGGGTNPEIHTFFDKLDALLQAASLGAGDNGALYMNSMILGKIKSAARRIGGWTATVDDFGRSIDMYNGVPMLDIGKKADGTLILPQTETQGTSTLASSIYAVRYGEDEADRAVTGLTNGGIQVTDLGELETKPALRTRIEFYTGLAVFGGTAAARLRGVLNG